MANQSEQGQGKSPGGEVVIDGLIGQLPVLNKPPRLASHPLYEENHLLQEQNIWVGNTSLSVSAGTFSRVMTEQGQSLLNADRYEFSKQEIVLPDGRKQLMFVVADGAESSGQGLGY